MMSLGWAPMMAAMMLPSAAPAIWRRQGGVLGRGSFAVAYVAVWTIAGLAIYAVYRPPAPAVAAALVAGALAYSLTPFARACRRRCRAERHSGARYGGWCVGSSLGLMAALVALDPMSLPLMGAVCALALVQKEVLA
jgi:predicted metal-binding membrane protein